MLDKVFIEFDVVLNKDTEEEVLENFNQIMIGNIYEIIFHKNVLEEKYKQINPNIKVEITSIREV